MNSIVYVGMDVHKESFTVCCYTFDADMVQYQQKLNADYKQVLKYLENIRKHFPEDAEYVCGYEAGCLGYTLYHQLISHGRQVHHISAYSNGCDEYKQSKNRP